MTILTGARCGDPAVPIGAAADGQCPPGESADETPSGAQVCITKAYKDFAYCMSRVGERNLSLERVAEEKKGLGGAFGGAAASIGAEARAATKFISERSVGSGDKLACVDAFRSAVGLVVVVVQEQPTRPDPPPDGGAAADGGTACVADLRKCFVQEATGYGQYAVVEARLPAPVVGTHVVVSGGCKLGRTNNGHNTILLESYPLSDGWHCKNGDQANIATAGEVVAMVRYCACSE